MSGKLPTAGEVIASVNQAGTEARLNSKASNSRRKGMKFCETCHRPEPNQAEMLHIKQGQKSYNARRTEKINNLTSENTVLRDRVTALTEALERAREALKRAHVDTPDRSIVIAVADIDRALYRGEEEKG